LIHNWETFESTTFTIVPDIASVFNWAKHQEDVLASGGIVPWILTLPIWLSLWLSLEHYFRGTTEDFVLLDSLYQSFSNCVPQKGVGSTKRQRRVMA